jgi:hypothetical protein
MRYTAASQKSDLLDVTRTNTYVIAAMMWMLDNLWTPVLMLSVRTGRSSGYHSMGMAVDCYPANWATNERATCIDMMTALARNPFVITVGLGGITKRWKGDVPWPRGDSPFILFDDNDLDHLHFAVATTGAPPGTRAKRAGYTKYTG